MDKIKILWADDEIDLLKPQLLFLEKKGYEVITVTNGYDAIEEYESNKNIDVVFLDESMPGLTGLETLTKIKENSPHLPCVMITKNEAEDIMEEAIGSQIDDYLIKPVNPNQILLTLKKIIDNKRLIREKTNTDYQTQFREILMEINSGLDQESWPEIYKKIISWELKLGSSSSDDMAEILAMQKREANAEFSKFIERNYVDWIQDGNGPTMSHNVLRNKLFPEMDENIPTVFLLLDCLRFDQWKSIEPVISELFTVEKEDHFYSILPTATQYARNAIFAGMMPDEIQQNYKGKWLNDNEEGGKNMHEKYFMEQNLNRTIRREIKMDYVKVTNNYHAKLLNDNVLNYLNNDLTVIVYNFIDMMSHARTEMEVLKELAGDENAYRSLTKSWFLHSPLWSALQKIAEKKVKLFIATDHGTIRVKNPVKVIGDRETTTNLRYKVGRNLKYTSKELFEVTKPELAKLPRPNMSSSFIFAREDDFFLYPKNYNHFNNFYKNTFQHGGISLEEMICPFISLKTK